MPKPTSKTELREVMYGEVKARVLRGDNALTAKQAMEYLGWQTEEEYIAGELAKLSEKAREKASPGFGGDYTLTDEKKQKIRCLNNDHNRPFSESWAKTLAQDILNGNWRLNGETIVIGKTGQILSAQHRLIGLVIAKQIWEGDNKAYWQAKHETEPKIETIIVYGIEESPEVTRTLDNVKPRSLADVLFSDHLLYGKVKKSDRGPMCRMTQHAVRMLWDRIPSGSGGRRRDDAFSPHMTHSEAIDFIDRHKHVVQAVQSIYTLYTDDKNGSWKGHNERMSAGYAAGLLYLMGSSDSDVDDYAGADIQSDRKMKWSSWETATEYWKAICTGDTKVHEVRYALSRLNDEDGSLGGTRNEKAGILIKGFLTYKEGHKIKADDLELKYGEDQDGIRFLDEFPSCGGVDLGPNVRQRDPQEAGEGPAGEPTPEEIETGKEEQRKQREETKRRKAEERKASKNGQAGPKLHDGEETATDPEEDEEQPDGTEPEEPGKEDQPADSEPTQEPEPVATE